MEERANARHCGWPHCCKRIPIPSSDPDAATKVRIDYKTKRLLQVGESRYYCSTSCLEACTLFMSTLDDSSPLTRRNQLLEHAERLIEQNGNSIEGFLDALTPEKAVRQVAGRSNMEEHTMQVTNQEEANSNSSSDMEKMWIDSMRDGSNDSQEKKTYKRLRPRGKRDSNSSSSNSSSSSSNSSGSYITRPGRVDQSDWTGVTNKFDRERSDRDLDEKARLLLEKQEQELDARARREEEEEQRRLLKLNVKEKVSPTNPQSMTTVEQGIASMSIENYNPLEGRPEKPPHKKDKEPERFVLKFDINEFKTTNADKSISKESLFTVPSSSSSSSSSIEAKLKGSSSFVLLWSTLEQFYKHLKAKSTVDGRDGELLEDLARGDEDESMGAAAFNTGPLAQLLERGVKAAELALDMSAFLASLHNNNHEAYRMAVNHMIAQAKMTSSPSLNSTQWRALGVLIIDKAVLSMDAMLKDPNFDVSKWDERVEGQAGRLKLDTSEMFLLRDYWDDLSNRK